MFSFDEYWKALDGVGPKLRENILQRAENDTSLTWEEFKKLVDKAYR